MNSGCRGYLATYDELIRELPAIRKEATRLYESGAVKAAGPADAAATGDSRAPKATDLGTALSGSLDQLLARSACTHPEFRKAVAGKDGKFLEGLRGRLVIWRGMLVESAKEKKDRCVVRAMVGGSSYAAELPPGSEVAGLLPGAALVIAGELRMTKSGWTFRVAAWGRRASVEAGEPMTLCKWPEGDGKAEGGAGAE